MPLPALSMPPTLRLVMPTAMKLRQIPPRRIANQNNVSALSTVPSIRPALRHMRLPSEGHTTRTTSAGSYEDPGAVVEHPAIVVSDAPTRILSTN